MYMIWELFIGMILVIGFASVIVYSVEIYEWFCDKVLNHDERTTGLTSLCTTSAYTLKSTSLAPPTNTVLSMSVLT